LSFSASFYQEKKMISRQLTIAVLIVLLAVPLARAERWPFPPGDEPAPLGNNFGEYQNYGGSPYYHDGLDLLGPSHTEVDSVSSGYVVYIRNDDPLYSGIMITPDAGGTEPGWLYWHIDPATFTVGLGDYININDKIGETAEWPVANFHHTHFNYINFTGGWYIAIGNPLEFMVPDTDPDAPTFANAYSGQLFAICNDNGSNYQLANNVHGKVDIIALIRDKINHPTWQVVPYTISYKIDGTGGSVPETVLHTFTGQIPDDTTIGVLYKDDSTCNSRGDYDYRDFYWIVTNTDGDNLVEASDVNGCWDTTTFPDGDYTITVRAWDEYGNLTEESMPVTVKNTGVGIDIADFVARGVKEGVELTWSCGELGVSFDLYRRLASPTSNDAESNPLNSSANVKADKFLSGFEKINSSEIRGESPYSYLDTSVQQGKTYVYELVAHKDGESNLAATAQTVAGQENPPSFTLAAPYPNPAEASVTFAFSITRTETVNLQIYDLSGRLVKKLIGEQLEAGQHKVEWSLDSDQGTKLTSGLYLAILSTPEGNLAAKLAVAR
jgi:hypothetical protein